MRREGRAESSSYTCSWAPPAGILGPGRRVSSSLAPLFSAEEDCIMYQVDFKKEIGLVYLKQPNPHVATGWVFLIGAQVD